MFEKNERTVSRVIGGRKKSSRAPDKWAVDWGRTIEERGLCRVINTVILILRFLQKGYLDRCCVSIPGHAFPRKGPPQPGPPPRQHNLLRCQKKALPGTVI